MPCRSNSSTVLAAEPRTGGTANVLGNVGQSQQSDTASHLVMSHRLADCFHSGEPVLLLELR